jgi:hypothetical protein
MNSVLIGGRKLTNPGRAHLKYAICKKYIVLYHGMIYDPCYFHRMA